MDNKRMKFIIHYLDDDHPDKIFSITFEASVFPRNTSDAVLTLKECLITEYGAKTVKETKPKVNNYRINER